MLYKWGIVFVLLGAAAFLCSCEHRQEPAQKHKRIELLIYEGTLGYYNGGATVIVNGEDVTHKETLTGVTYVCLDSGLAILRTRPISDTSIIEDTAYYFSDNYVSNPSFDPQNGIKFDDSLIGYMEVRSVYLREYKEDSSVMTMKKYRLPSMVANMINHLGHPIYGKEMNVSKKSLTDRVEQIHKAMNRYCVVPTLKFIAPVIKRD